MDKFRNEHKISELSLTGRCMIDTIVISEKKMELRKNRCDLIGFVPVV